MKTFITWKRLKSILFLKLSKLPMPGHVYRPLFVKWGGVKVLDYKNTFFGEDIRWDTIRPDLIIIEKGVRLTAGVCIITHFINPQTNVSQKAEVRIKEGAFIGVNTIITKPVIIGKCSVVGAGSVVTKDIPDYEVWAGNPAKFIRSIQRENNNDNNIHD